MISNVIGFHRYLLLELTAGFVFHMAKSLKSDPDVAKGSIGLGNLAVVSMEYPISHDGIHGAIYGVPWIPSIYPLYVSINIPAPWIRHGIYHLANSHSELENGWKWSMNIEAKHDDWPIQNGWIFQFATLVITSYGTHWCWGQLHQLHQLDEIQCSLVNSWETDR